MKPNKQTGAFFGNFFVSYRLLWGQPSYAVFPEGRAASADCPGADV